MANWALLGPLKALRFLMTLGVWFLLGYLVLAPKHSLREYTQQKGIQSKSLVIGKARVIAKSGLKIWSNPNRSSTVLTIAAYNDNLNIIDRNSRTVSINGKKRKWYKVEYNHVEGYVLNRYLEE